MLKYKDEQPKANDIIEKLGGNKVIANKLGISAAAISYWRRNGIPPLQLIHLESVFGKKALVS